ncbi:MAG: trypsin-like serine protease [Anaerolineales bacterium]
MKKLTFVLVLVLILAFGLASVAYAITNGEPDDGRHPYVTLLVFGWETPDGFVPGWRCSGALIAPDVVLTAGHCTDGATGARVWFEEGPVEWGTWEPSDTSPTCAGETGYPCTGDAAGTPNTNPKYRSDENPYGGGNGLPAFSYRDVGVVVLDVAESGITPADLPDAGLVDTLKNKTDVDFVGYGVQYQAQIPGNELPQPPPYYRWTGPRARMYAPSQMVSGNFVHSAEYMRLSLNPGGGKGGTCFGDSGGPDLLGDTNTVLAVNSYVTNINCSGVGYSSRVDIPEILTWINTFMTQP